MKLAKISGTLSRSSSSSSGSSGNNNQVAHTIADLPAQWMGATFGPGAPIQPLPSGDENQIPREIDYPISVNASLMPRTGYGLMPFDVLTQAYETVTEVRMPCSTIIRELCGFLPRLTDDDGNEVDDHPMKFLTVSPDRMTPFSVWLARFLQSKQVYDAGALFIMSDGHDLQGLRYIDGSTLFLIVDDHGEMPLPNQSDPGVRTSTQYVEKLRKWMEKHPDPYFDRHPSFEDGVSFHDTTLRKSRDGATILKTPAFAQVIHGVPFGWYSQDEIWYRPSMRRVNAPYGTSYIEMAWPWVVAIANIVAFELSHYRTGNMPEGWAAVPKDMFPTLEKIQAYELGFNQRMSSGPSERQRQRFVPEGTKWFPTKKADFPDQLYLQARDNISLLCGIPPSEYGKVPGQGLGGKGFADAMQSALFRMGLMPPKAYIDDAINENLKRFGVDDVFFELSIPTESTDPDKQKNTIKELFAAGLLTLNDALGQMNLNPVSGGDIHIIVSGGTVIVLEDYLKGKRDPPKGAPGIQSLPGATSGQPGVAGSSQSISEVASQATSESHGKGLMTKQDYRIVTKILETGKLPNTGVVYSIPLKTKMEKVDATHTDGAMVAIFLPHDVAGELRKIADSIGLPSNAEQETPENMHVTLAFLPDHDNAAENSARILGCIQSVALWYQPLKGNVQGYGVFNGQDGMKVLYATLDIPELPFIRSEICQNLDKAGIEYGKDHGFVPHITLAYFPEDFELPAGFAVPDMPAEIRGITLALGEKLTTITFGEGETTLGKDWSSVDRDDHGRWAGAGQVKAGGKQAGMLEDRLVNQGGFSVSLLGKQHDPPPHGYMVSTHPELSDSFPISIPRAQAIQRMRDYIKNNAAALAEKNSYLGGWNDKSSGKAFLDVSQWEGDLETAKSLGASHNQIAIYDLAHGTDIPTGGTGEKMGKIAPKKRDQAIFVSARDLNDQAINEFLDALLGPDPDLKKSSRLDDHMDGQPIEELKRPDVDPSLNLVVTPPEDPGNEHPRIGTVEGKPKVVTYDQLRDLDALQKHCGVCPEDDEYYQAPIARESTFDFPKDHHVNDVEIVAMMPEGLPAHAALWKPEGGEDETLAARIGGPQYLREEAAYLLDRSLKFFMVPVAYVASVDDEHGAALYYVMGNDPATDMDNYDPEWVERAAIEDYIMQNTDRHAGNYLTHPDDPRRPVLIDNGLSFPATDQYFRSPFVDAMQGEGFSEESLDAIEHCLRDAATWTDIRDLVGEEACELAQTRAEELLEEGGIPDEAPTTIAGTGTDSDGNITDEGRELTGDLDKAAPIHLPKGSPNGGQFAPAGTGKKAKRPKRAKKPRKPKQPRQKHVRAAGKGDIQPHAMITGFTEKK